jgi:tRNA (guanine-N7-)-methyltransferase
MEREPNRKGAFFGRRKGHRLRRQQAALLDTMLPRLEIVLEAPAPGDLTRLFPAPVESVRLEIGFGSGEHLIAEAERHPGSGFIGSEPFVNGMAKALAAIETKMLGNVRLHFGDAIFLLDWLPAGSLAGVDLLYPDPWPKRRHWKRRFIQKRTVAELARILQPGGELRFVTDVPDYAAWTLQHLTRSPAFAWNAERAVHWREPWADFPGTRYEAKAKREGRVPCYLLFRRTESQTTAS